MKYKGGIHATFDGEQFYLGEWLSLKEAIWKWEEFDGEDSYYEVYGVEHTHYRTGFMPEEARVDYEPCHGWWIVEKEGRCTGKATLLKLKSKVKK